MTFVDKVMNGIDTSNLQSFELITILEMVERCDENGWTIEDTKEFVNCIEGISELSEDEALLKMQKIKDKYNK